MRYLLLSLLMGVVVGVVCDEWELPDKPPGVPGQYPAEPSLEYHVDMDQFISETMEEAINGSHEAPYKISNKPEDVHFYIYSNPQDPWEFHELKYKNEDSIKKLVSEGKIHPNAHWKFLIHGFTQNQNSSFPQLAVKEYLRFCAKEGKELNVVVVDWGRLAYDKKNGSNWKQITSYPTSVKNVRIAGKRVGKMIKFLKRLKTRDLSPEEQQNLFDSRMKDWVKNKSLEEQQKFKEGLYQTALMDLRDVHIIGFSLGAHVAGKAGMTLYKNVFRRVSRITGLDPAGPMFWKHFPDMGGRLLRPGDSDYLDIIHTNAGGFGLNQNLGDVDFYVNSAYFDSRILGGALSQTQPICKRKFGSHPVSVKQCSHSMAPVYFAMSINHPNAFHGCKECKPSFLNGKENCKCKTNDPLMGEWWRAKNKHDSNKVELGEFYLRVSDDASTIFKNDHDVNGNFFPFDSNIKNLLRSPSILR